MSIEDFSAHATLCKDLFQLDEIRDILFAIDLLQQSQHIIIERLFVWPIVFFYVQIDLPLLWQHWKYLEVVDYFSRKN